MEDAPAIPIVSKVTTDRNFYELLGAAVGSSPNFPKERPSHLHSNLYAHSFVFSVITSRAASSSLSVNLRLLDLRCTGHFPPEFFLFRALFLLLLSYSALITSIVSAMEGFFVGPIMEKIINTSSDYLKDQFRWQTGMKEELERLRENHPKIQAVVSVANQAQLNDKNGDLNKWIWQLRDAIDEAVDVLDDFEYTNHKEQLTKNTEETKKRKFPSFISEIPSKLIKIGKRALKIDPNLKRLEEAVQKLDKVSADVSIFLHLLDSAKQEQKEQEVDFYRTRETGSLPKNDLIGRGEHKESVVQWLRKPSNEHRGTELYRNISLLSIVGHGGMGKTTLLQHIYEDEMTKEFDLKMWVCVSNNFDPKEVIADMLELIKKERPRLEKLEALQWSLKNEVMSKRFLLVLDDVWEEEEEEERDKSKWENVLVPLASGGFDSKILVTTRTDSIALMFAKVITRKKEIVKLEGLEEDESLQLLYSHAFAGVENPTDDHKKLRAIAGEIVKKLLGSPLAAKVVGGVLNSLDLDERRWSTVLESNLLGQNSINSILRLSYIVLPNHLQNCFAFSCLFPQDHEFDRDDLVRMWIALGFIQPSQGMTMEDIGGRYFDVLVKKTLFDKVRGHYKMHDLIHESASNFFAQECGKLVDDEESSVKISENIRHLSVQTTNPYIIKKIGQFKYLHSLILFYKTSNQDLCNVLFEIFKASRSLRLLYISAPRFEMIPEEIGNLIHLRFLKFTFEGSTMLPRSLSNLYHLQYIIFDRLECPWEVNFDDSLPRDINNLSNLRYVKYPMDFISLLICGIGKLQSLQELNMFDLRDVSGYRIGELENMNDLCKLGINCLENVKEAEEACSAKLCEKRRLIDLTLCWSWSHTNSRNTDLDENVLDNLQPPKCLRNLRIERYMGTRSAIWMNNANPIYNLERINLIGCLDWETIPPFGQLPFLKSLKLSNMPKVKWLESKFNGNDKYRAFPLLEELYINELEALEDWFEAGVAAEDGCLFPCLIELTLLNCPKLKELPTLPSKLKRSQIYQIGCTTLNFCSNSNPIPLESLDVSNCPNITSLSLADEIARLAALTYLEIMKCPNLISLGRYREVETTNNCHLILSDLFISDPLVLLMEPLRSIASLKKLRIEDNDELVSFPNEAEQWFLKVRPSLSELQFGSLKSLESLPSSLESLSSLHSFVFSVITTRAASSSLSVNLRLLGICCTDHFPPEFFLFRALFLLLFSCFALSTSIVAAMERFSVGPIMEKIINTCSDYLKDQFRWQTGMKEDLEKLRENHPKIQVVVSVANQAQLNDKNGDLNKWIWQLRDAIDEAVDVLDDFEDPNLKRLEEAVQKLDKVSADVTIFLHLLDTAKQEQKEKEVDFYRTRETGSLPKNELIGRGKHKDFLMQWLRKPSNEHRGTDLYRKISLLSIVGHGGMGKTTLLQHIYEDEMTKEFDLKMWVFQQLDPKEVIADMLELLKKERPRLEKLEALQWSLKNEVMSKRFLLVLDDVWEEEEERDKSKWENVLAPLASGGFDSKILVITRMDSIALMFAKVITKKKEIVKLESLEEDECLQLLYSHAFACVENPPDDHKKLRAIAGEIVKKLLGSPLAAKVIGGVLNSLDLDERRWRTVLESNLLVQNSINSILRLSYIVLPNHLQNCFAFCCLFPQDHEFDKDDLV
ncbi:hypothetical protein M5K25_008736 [Dendrobium thyrsiflorum]|uniref:Uncharacterized protein n=1 Tax=Dendrobium thyrsiflorum TaxID=117978 RepID=A0ABD0VG93_DENTH